jgi:hypothetical protein
MRISPESRLIALWGKAIPSAALRIDQKRHILIFSVTPSKGRDPGAGYRLAISAKPVFVHGAKLGRGEINGQHNA